MSTGEQVYDRINDYGAVRVSLASPHDIKAWSFGEVKKPETINYRTYKPEKDGLFCERIFGPEKDWECACGKYKGMKYKGMICDRCGVKVTHSRVRRKRMGHIELAAPIVHIWFFKAMPSRLGTILDMRTSALEKVIYYQEYVVTDAGDTPLTVGQLLTDEEYRKCREQYGDFDAEMGADAIRSLLKLIDLVTLPGTLREELRETKSKQKMKDLSKRLKLLEQLRDSENSPDWMVLDVVPVIPPDLRPLVLLDSGNFATSDLNDLYRRIINRNNRLKKLVDLNAPEVIIRNEKRMLQQSVDALFDNNRCKRPVLGSSNRPLKSLTDMIKGKQGRFRENLLGKRVDYSARSVIVVGPDLKLHQCGLPAKKIALELFQPFIIHQLKELGHADTIKSAKKMLERKEDPVWDILAEVVKDHPVLLNRAPTLHRMGIQAFEPKLIEGNAIKIHPLVCKGFNADFDGDQMAVHLPLSIEAQVEATTLMMSTNNIFSPANGSPIISADQDIVMGCYFMTVPQDGEVGEGKAFGSANEVRLAYDDGRVTLHSRIKLRLTPGKIVIQGKGEKEVHEPGKSLNTTVGRALFNHDVLHPNMPYYNQTNGKKQLAAIIADCYRLLGRRETIDLLDRMKETGFRESTMSGLSFATSDLRTPAIKTKALADAEKTVAKLRKNYQRGLITDSERYNLVLDEWTKARDIITEAMMKEFEHDIRDGRAYLNPIFLMATSGARGGVDQIRQLAGMRGLMAKPNGQIIEEPIKANFRSGLNVLEYFSSTHGARKGLADTALKTADSGYLTRKLADVAQNVVITMDDCGTSRGVTKGVIYKGEQVERSLAEGITGRVARDNIVNPFTDEHIVSENELIDHDKAKAIEALNIDKLTLRSPMTCEAALGVCRRCYGMDLATGALVEEGTAVGVIAAQSIGEPGTQLTMRTFHIGGVADAAMQDNQVRNRKKGKVAFERINVVTNTEGESVALARNGEVQIQDAKGRELEKYAVPNGAKLFVKAGETVGPKTVLCQWDPHTTPILAEVNGKVRFEDLTEGETLRKEKDAGGSERWQVMEHKGDLHPQVIVQDAGGEILDVYFIPEKAYIEVRESMDLTAGTVVAKMPRDLTKNQDITGGLPRVTEVFEARRPKEPAVIAEIGGTIEVMPDKKRNKRVVKVHHESGAEYEHLIPTSKSLRVHGGDFVAAGDPICDGPLVPHDILRIKGEEEVQEYLTREIQNVYTSQRVDIDDKHIEIIVAQMLRKVKIESPGDTGLLPGSTVDKFRFRRRNQDLLNSVRVSDPGDSDYKEGTLVPKDVFENTVTELAAADKAPPKSVKPTPATATTQLLGITKASVQSESFISAASFQETTKVLTEAALASKMDYLVGLKENVILGHLVPAGTGFKSHIDSEVRIRPEALEAMGLTADSANGHAAPAPRPQSEAAAE